MRFESLNDEFEKFFGEKLEFNLLKSKNRIEFRKYYTEETKNKVYEYYYQQ